MKCELAAALLHRPRVLFLDEPTIGLDVTMQVVVREFIRHYNQRHGATVLLTCHYMDDVVALCPRVIVIDKGQLIVRRRPRRAGPDRCARRSGWRSAWARIPTRTRSPRSATWCSSEGREVIVQVAKDDLAATVSRALSTLDVSDFTVTAAPLEEVMSELFARSRAARDEERV